MGIFFSSLQRYHIWEPDNFEVMHCMTFHALSEHSCSSQCDRSECGGREHFTGNIHKALNQTSLYSLWTCSIQRVDGQPGHRRRERVYQSHRAQGAIKGRGLGQVLLICKERILPRKRTHPVNELLLEKNFQLHDKCDPCLMKDTPQHLSCTATVQKNIWPD